MRTTTFLFIAGLWIMAISCNAPASQQAEDMQPTTPSKEVYELRTYHFSTDEQMSMTEEYLAKAAIPAMNRMGIKQVGAFAPLDTAGGKKIVVLIPAANMDDLSSLNERMFADAKFIQDGARYLHIAHPEKAFERIESSYLVAFDSMTQMVVPPFATTNPNRILELRSYESYSELKGIAKVKMFNEGGEVTIFNRLGFNPVFFAQAISGSQQPNLVYMTSFENAEIQQGLWDKFRNDPAWTSIKDLPEYANTVSKIHKDMLRALPCSQI